jgi:hypothetical protein
VDGTTFRALRVTPRPVNYGVYGIYRIAARTGSVGPFANFTEYFQFRWSSSSALCLVSRIGLSIGASRASSNLISRKPFLTLIRCLNWTANGTGGTDVTPVGDDCKLRTSMATSQVANIRVCTTTPLGVGTKAEDSVALGAVQLSIGAGALTTTVSAQMLEPTWMFDSREEGNMPLVFGKNEGFTLQNGNVAWSTNFLCSICINVAWAEVASF